MKKITGLILLVLNLIILIVSINHQAYAKDDDWIFDLGQFRDNTYYRVKSSWLNDFEVYNKDKLTFYFQDSIHLNNNINYNGEFAVLNRGEEAVIEVEVSKTALYHIELQYEIVESFSTAPTFKLFINDEIQYNELEELALPVSWILEQRDDDNRYNRYGDELLNYSVSETKVYIEELVDSKGRYLEPYYFKLEEGINKITIKSLNHQINLSELSLLKAKEVKSYDEYINSFSNPKLSSYNTKIEGQNISNKNDIEVKAGYYKGASLSPSAYKTKVLNILDGSSMSRSGTSVTYDFNIDETGFYNINLKYLQQEMIGMTSARKILIDGEVPFKELEIYHFSYNKKWMNHQLSSTIKEPFMFYLEKGSHQLTMESTTAHLVDYIDTLYQVMNRVNSIGFSISQLTGNSKDSLINWDILKFMPNIKEELTEMAKTIRTIYDDINEFSKEHKRPPAISTLLIAARQLERLAKNPNKIPNKLTELNEGSGSAYQLIGEAINQVSQQPLSIDYINVYGKNFKLDKANANMFKRFWFGFKSFIYSFFDKRYKLSSGDKDVLEVWVGQSTLYLDIMQNLIDDEFTKETGIKVNLSILPNTQKIILNHATKTNPDVVLSIDSWEPYAYALRGMLMDLKEFDDFNEVVSPYHPNNFTPLIFEDGVYGIPETQGIYLLFYRKDIFEFLNINPPNDWDDVINILPILQSYQMNFFHPLGGEGAYKGFGLTSPLIYQHKAEIYSDQSHRTTFNEERTIEAITFMTDLFNRYNLPQQVPSFFEHFRSGSLPVGISTIDLYLQLKYAAPELTGQWGILPIPGIFDNDLGEVARWAPTYGKASIILSDTNKPDESFSLIKWWNKKETQLKYLENIKMILGERYLFIPSNIETLQQSVWDLTVKEQALIQANWARIPAVMPGSYIIERELTNIWNKVVIDKVNPRVAIDQSIPRINRELERKLEEFGYLKGGEVVREYIIPKNENIQKWIP